MRKPIEYIAMVADLGAGIYVVIGRPAKPSPRSRARYYPRYQDSITPSSLRRCQRAQLALLERGE